MITQLVTSIAVHERPPGEAVATYEVALSPNFVTGVHDTSADTSPDTACNAVGADGVAINDTDDAPNPPNGTELTSPTFEAVTVNRYESPFVRPEIVMGDADPVTDWLWAELVADTALIVYPEIVAPPVSAGESKDSVASELPATIDVTTGALGRPTGTT